MVFITRPQAKKSNKKADKLAKKIKRKRDTNYVNRQNCKNKTEDNSTNLLDTDLSDLESHPPIDQAINLASIISERGTNNASNADNIVSNADNINSGTNYNNSGSVHQMDLESQESNQPGTFCGVRKKTIKTVFTTTLFTLGTTATVIDTIHNYRKDNKSCTQNP